MKYGSNIHPNSRSSNYCDSSIEAIGKQSPTLGGTAHAVLRFSYWLVALVLGLASSSGANAADHHWLGTNAREPINLRVAKAPKLYPANFSVLRSGNSDEFQVQRPTINSAPEPTAMPPAASPLQDENWATDADELVIETVEVEVPDQFARPALFTASTGSEIEFGFSDANQLDRALAIGTAPLSLGEGTVADTSFDVAFAQTNLIAQATGSMDEIPWQFSFEPFFYLPFGANGDITVRGINAPINAGIGDIFDAIVNDLNFAAFGRLEAWKGPWGIFFSGAYMNLGTGRTADIPVPPDLQQAGLPPQVSINAAAGTSFLQLDLGGAYRFGDGNLSSAFRTADTEFDLGPFVFDVLAGVRLYSFNNDLVLTSDLGNRFEFSQSRTVLEPMIGGRARWNLSHNLAALAGASMSGFGIGDLTFSVAGYAGIDWLFSGNTSLLASYGFTYLDYSSGSSGLNLFTHGPNIGVKFRF